MAETPQLIHMAKDQVVSNVGRHTWVSTLTRGGGANILAILFPMLVKHKNKCTLSKALSAKNTGNIFFTDVTMKRTPIRMKQNTEHNENKSVTQQLQCHLTVGCGLV